MKKTYTIKLEIDEGSTKSKMTRTNDGFNGLELLGILEIARKEILKQLEGVMKPDAIERQFVVDGVAAKRLTLEWIAEIRITKDNDNVTARVCNWLMAGLMNDPPYNAPYIYVDDITRKDFMKLRNVGAATWDQFVKLRGH